MIGQQQLAAFREEIESKANNNFSVLVKARKLPMALIEDPEKKGELHGERSWRVRNVKRRLGCMAEGSS